MHYVIQDFVFLKNAYEWRKLMKTVMQTDWLSEWIHESKPENLF